MTSNTCSNRSMPKHLPFARRQKVAKPEGASPSPGPRRGPERGKARRAHGIKRALDIAGAATGLVLSAPILAGAALAVRATMGSPVLFRQLRPGLHGEPFELIKLRTMRALREGEGDDDDDVRLTRLGKLLRATSIDELPSLWNVLRGEMSLVGPRPLLLEYLELYTPEQARRHHVKPGLTGWAQIHGRNARDWDEKFALDTWYVDHWSLGLDFRILLRTPLPVLLGAGTSHPAHATAPHFRGAASSSAAPDAQASAPEAQASKPAPRATEAASTAG
jgi:lipopolysaccharide/colanic/teichoic acid biosynthesis glycosyltransferase